MPIRRKTLTSLEVERQKKCQAEIAELTMVWRDGGHTQAGRIELDEKYKECSNFSDDCPVCLAGRQDFMNGLNKIADGDLLEGVAGIKNSFTAVRYKFSKLVSDLEAEPKRVARDFEDL